MMWPFSRKARPESEEVKQARAAVARAQEDIDKVSARTDEVNLYYVSLRTRRVQNNFGDALVAAMERRG